MRPEWGHATNAITIVGRRDRTRGLFLDRRAFLTSYDPTQDDAESTILTRILCGRLSRLRRDQPRILLLVRRQPTAGDAAPSFRITSPRCVGVMDGYMSDLRTGLPWQMVEIHEPVRSLFIIETTAESMLRIMERNEGIRRLCPTAGSSGADPSRDRERSAFSRRPVPDLPTPGHGPAQGRVFGRLVSRLARPPGVRGDRARSAPRNQENTMPHERTG